MRVDESFAARGIAKARAQCFRQNVGHSLIDELNGSIHGAANLAGAETADGFVDGNDAAHFGGIEFFVAENFDLRIDHFEARGAELIDFRFAMKDEELAWF